MWERRRGRVKKAGPKERERAIHLEGKKGRLTSWFVEWIR